MLGKEMFLLYAVQFICLVTKGHSLPHPTSDESIDVINSKEKTWKTDMNFPKNVSTEYLMFAGTFYDSRIEDLPVKTHTKGLSFAVIESFDARLKWPYCHSLKEIRSQGGCGSCWAVSAVSAMTDRVCIHSQGRKNFHFSINDVLSCSHNCGCGGGSLYDAWIFWMTDGIVSGGPYNSQEGCRPYEIPPCPGDGCRPTVMTPPCKPYCQDNYPLNYTQDKNYGRFVYRVNGEEEIKAEVMINGPVTVKFPVYPDLHQHTTGVYKHTWGEKYDYYHAVKVIGWGVEKGQKYWLIANSWGTTSGDKGFLKFLRGENHLGIEEYAVAGLPR